MWWPQLGGEQVGPARDRRRGHQPERFGGVAQGPDRDKAGRDLAHLEAGFGGGRVERLPGGQLGRGDDDRTLVETLNLGAHEFAAKPLSQETFLAVVEYITEFA